MEEQHWNIISTFHCQPYLRLMAHSTRRGLSHSTHLTLHLSNYNPSTEQYTIVRSKSQDAHLDTGWNGMKFNSSTNCTQTATTDKMKFEPSSSAKCGNQWFSFCMFQLFVIHSTCSLCESKTSSFVWTKCETLLKTSTLLFRSDFNFLLGRLCEDISNSFMCIDTHDHRHSD